MRESRIPFQRMSQPLMEECDGVEMWHELEMEVMKRKGRREFNIEVKKRTRTTLWLASIVGLLVTILCLFRLYFSLVSLRWITVSLIGKFSYQA